MIKQVFYFATASMLLFSVACTQAPDAPKAEAGAAQPSAATTTDAVNYKVNAATSLVNWVGTKPTGQHTGTFKLKDGSFLAVAGDQIQSGSFVIDIASLNNTDQSGEDKQHLEEHLKSADFFDVAKNPEGKFEITAVKPFTPDPNQKAIEGATHTIEGNLTLKGVSKGISFPAVVKIDPSGTLTAQSNFNINRKEWGMSYHADESLKDKFIRPEVNIGFSIVAAK